MDACSYGKMHHVFCAAVGVASMLRSAMDLVFNFTWQRVVISSVHKSFEKMHMVLVEKGGKWF